LKKQICRAHSSKFEHVIVSSSVARTGTAADREGVGDIRGAGQTLQLTLSQFGIPMPGLGIMIVMGTKANTS